jgi:hypothetical protein
MGERNRENLSKFSKFGTFGGGLQGVPVSKAWVI